jgi:hypothetical protein
MSVVRRFRAGGIAVAIATSTIVAPFLAAPALADAGGGNGALQFCKSIQGFYPAANMIGPCTSYFVSHYNADGLPAAQSATDQYFCKIELVPFGVFSSVGQCVTVLKQSEGIG